MEPLRIAIDASRTTVQKATGTEHYARALIRALIQLNDTHEVPHELHLYFRDAPSKNLFPNSNHVHQHVIPFPRIWTHIRWAWELWRTRPDVVFVPAHTLPFIFPGRAVVTVHDLGYRHFPQAHSPLQRWYLDLTTRFSAARATQVLADSQATADDLYQFYGTKPDKITIAYPGVSQPEIQNIDIRTKYDLPPQYFVFIGTLQPRKNIQRMIAAFQQWKQGHPSNIGLVLAGNKGWLFDDAWLHDTEDVFLIGYIEEGDKGILLQEAICLLFPSLYEGFGFPVLEAMFCDTPVIASNTSSLPELVGDAGILVDPLDVNAISNAIATVAIDEAKRQELRQLGKIQAQKFTWEQTAKQVMQVLEKASDQV